MGRNTNGETSFKKFLNGHEVDPTIKEKFLSLSSYYDLSNTGPNNNPRFHKEYEYKTVHLKLLDSRYRSIAFAYFIVCDNKLFFSNRVTANKKIDQDKIVKWIYENKELNENRIEEFGVQKRKAKLITKDTVSFIVNTLIEKALEVNTVQSKDPELSEKIKLESGGLMEFLKKNSSFIKSGEREQLIKSRIGQGAFRRRLLEISEEKKCRLCGIKNEKFLIASHIKPWIASNDEEKTDLNNGLLLCPNHDALFDRGYITFEENGEISLSPLLDENSQIFMNIGSIKQIILNDKQKYFMNYHRNEIFKRNLLI